MKLDDLADAQCEFKDAAPQFPLCQVHIVMWERQPAAGVPHSYESYSQQAQRVSQRSQHISQPVHPVSQQAQLVRQQAQPVSQLSHDSSVSPCKSTQSTAAAGDALSLTSTQTIIVEAMGDGRQTVIDLRDAVIQPTGKKHVVKLVLKRKDDLQSSETDHGEQDHTQQSSSFSMRRVCYLRLRSIHRPAVLLPLKLAAM